MRRTPHHTSDLESNVLKRVRSSAGVSRVELARHLGLAPPTVGIYVERLIEDGDLGTSGSSLTATFRLNPISWQCSSTSSRLA